MQFQTNRPIVERVLNPIKLTSEFPFHAGRHTLNNREIDFVHLHDIFEIGLCEKGKGFFVIENKVFPFSSGDVFIINHLEFHRACSADGKDCDWRFITTDPTRLLGPALNEMTLLDTQRLAGRNFSNRVTEAADPELNALCRAMIREYDAKMHFYQDNIRGLMLQFLIGLHRRHAPQTQKDEDYLSQRSAGWVQRLSPAVKKISTRFADELSVTDLAVECCMSEGHFRRFFVKTFGMGPMDYIHEYRISMAASLLLTTDRSVTDIGLSCGFPSLSSFNRQFKMRKKCAPREWRSKG
ncbi:MAG: helix-turn-helix transcriptional regulator [Fibrobacteres bacterium]|nr:helix-turn-helix transcriptional regulator [Fibrobacterota bacterium]